MNETSLDHQLETTTKQTEAGADGTSADLASELFRSQVIVAQPERSMVQAPEHAVEQQAQPPESQHDVGWALDVVGIAPDTDREVAIQMLRAKLNALKENQQSEEFIRHVEALDILRKAQKNQKDQQQENSSTQTETPQLSADNITHAAVELRKEQIATQLQSSTDALSALQFVREYLDEGGTLDELDQQFAVSLLQAEDEDKKYVEGVAEALQLERQRATDIANLTLRFKTNPDSLSTLMAEYETTYPDRQATVDLAAPDFTDEQKQIFDTVVSQKETEKKTHRLATVKAAIDTFLLDKNGKDLLSHSSHFLNEDEKQEFFKTLGITDEELETVQTLFNEALTKQVEIATQQERESAKLRTGQMIILALALVIDPRTREQMMMRMMQQISSPMLERLGIPPEMIESMFHDYTPTQELLRLSPWQLQEMIPKLNEQQLYELVKAMKPEDRQMFIAQHTWKGRALNRECQTHIIEFVTSLSSQQKRVLQIE